MMIAHASLPADDPKKVALVLAEIMQGEATPFPPGGPETWMAWAADDSNELEIAPRGALMALGDDGGNWRVSGAKRAGSEAHLAICVDRPAQEILDIARAAGWPCGRHDRGGFFHVNEVWVEGHFLIEFLDPRDAADYAGSMNRSNWKKIFGAAAAA